MRLSSPRGLSGAINAFVTDLTALVLDIKSMVISRHGSSRQRISYTATRTQVPPDRMLAASVIIPSFNRPKALAACLEGLSRSAMPRDAYEVIVVDDGSTEPLEPVAVRFGTRCLAQQNAGPGPARNLGAAKAGSDLLVFIDDDCIPAPEWLPALVARHQASPRDALAGLVVNGLTRNLCSEASQQLLDCIYQHFERYPRGTEAALPPFATTNNLAVPRRQFEQAGQFHHGFRLHASEDREFCARWLRQGWRLARIPEAVVHHFHDLNPASFCRQHFQYGRGGAQFRRLHPAPGRQIETASFYLSLLAYPLRDGLTPRALSVSALIGLSQAAMAAGVLRQMGEPNASENDAGGRPASR